MNHGSTAAPATALDTLRQYLWPGVALALALPLTLYAAAISLDWIDRPFPSFFLMENAVIPTVGGYDWPPDKDLLFHGVVESTDGIAVATGADVYRYAADRPVGTPVTYGIRKDGRFFHFTVPTMRFTLSDYLQTYGILFLFGCSNLILGLIVGFMQPATPQARVFLLHTTIAGLYPITSVFLHHPEFAVLNWVCLLAECVAPATFVHLALVFPIQRSFLQRRPRWIALPYAISAGLFVAELVSLDREPPVLWPMHTAYLYMAASLAFFGGSLVLAYRDNAAPGVRARIMAVLPGAVLAAGVQLVVFLNNSLGGGSVPVQFGLPASIAYYAGIAYAIGKHDLFDIDRRVRQSFVYGALTFVVLGAYALVLGISAQLIPVLGTRGQTLASMVFVVALAFAFDPMRRLVQNAIDRAFYREKTDYRKTISELSAAMTTLLDLEEVVTRVTEVPLEAMHLESASACLLEETGERSQLWRRTPEEGLRRREVGQAAAAMARWAAAHPSRFQPAAFAAVATRDAERAAVRDLLGDLGAAAVLPLVIRGSAIGLLILGPKRSGQPLGWEDIELLRTLANQTAIAVQNARSYDSLEELNRDLDERVQQRTDELRASNRQLQQAYRDLQNAQGQLVQAEKMASLGQLVAGVAHELNNPASFVHGALGNLEEYLDRLGDAVHTYERELVARPDAAHAVTETRQRTRLDYVLHETPELMRICRDGSERIKRIIEDLRTFARADRGKRAPTIVSEGIDSTIRLLGERLGRHGIAIIRDYRQVPMVDATPGQLNQVWMNLLTNAIDAVEQRQRPAIRIGTREVKDGDGSFVEVEVCDNGAGIEAGDIGKVFEPFFTTKDIGRGTGLGLSIAYGIVRGHGGTISIGSVPGEGTAVTVRLPMGT